MKKDDRIMLDTFMYYFDDNEIKIDSDCVSLKLFFEDEFETFNSYNFNELFNSVLNIFEDDDCTLDELFNFYISVNQIKLVEYDIEKEVFGVYDVDGTLYWLMNNDVAKLIALKRNQIGFVNAPYYAFSDNFINGVDVKEKWNECVDKSNKAIEIVKDENFILKHEHIVKENM